MKIMIVDDDATSLTIVGTVLQQGGHVVIERDTAIGTTRAILRERPDVVLLDVRMPGLTGDKLAALIGQQTTPRPIVVFHSSLSDGELAALVRETGAAGFVSKGMAPSAFLGRFEQVVALAQRNATRRQA